MQDIDQQATKQETYDEFSLDQGNNQHAPAAGDQNGEGASMFSFTFANGAAQANPMQDTEGVVVDGGDEDVVDDGQE